MSAIPPPPRFPPQDIENPVAAEFLHHPDFRATAGFILGWVFWCSVSYAYRSQFFQLLGRICWNFFRGKSARSHAADLEARASQYSEKASRRRVSRPDNFQSISNEAALVFTLNLCFTFASFAEFCSILAYDPGGADTACAFTVAWGNMAGQAARLIGLSILVLQLKQRGATTVEFYCLCTVLVIALSFILAYNATNTGDIVHVQTLGMSICMKEIYLPTALLASIGFVVLEIYVALRFFGWGQRRAGLRHMFAKSANLQVARASSLLLIDVLNFAPSVAVTNVLTQFIPFSIGSLVVLIVFNYRVLDSPVQPDEAPDMAPAPHSRMPTPLPASQLSRQASPAAFSRAIEQSPDRDVILIDTPTNLPPSTSSNRAQPPSTAPSSAPPRIGDASVFADLQARRILPFQVQYAEQLDRHIHTGPIAPARSKPRRPHVQVVIEDIDTVSAARNVAPSIIGSDILRRPPMSAISSRRDTRETTGTVKWSPGSTGTPSDYTSHRSSPGTPTTIAGRHSNLSIATSTMNRSVSSGSRKILSSILSRHGSRKIRSPTDASLKMPWRGVARASFGSARTFGGRGDELPPVVEGRAETSEQGSGSNSNSLRGSQSSAKRPAISHPHSLRSSKQSSPRLPRPGLPLPLVSGANRPSSQHLAVPGTPTLPDSPSSIRPSSQYIVQMPASPPSASYGRAQGSGRLHGPRSPPMSGSQPNLRGAWPKQDEDEAKQRTDELGRRHRRRRSDSCPELPPLDLGERNLRPYPSGRRGGNGYERSR